MFNFKRLTVIFYDLCTIPVAWLGAYWIRQNLSPIPHGAFDGILQHLPFIIIIQASIFWLFHLYRGEWRFASIPDLMRILKAIVVGVVAILVLLYFTSMTFYQTFSMPPRSVVILYALLELFLLGGARLAFRAIREFSMHREFKENVLIIGAGFAGEALIRELLRDHRKRYYPRVLIDDGAKKQGMEILGVRVVGRVQDLPKVVEQYGIDQIFIAIPSADGKAMRAIVEVCGQLSVPYRTLPGLSDIASGKVSMNDLRKVSVEDLLGREAIDLHEPQLLGSFRHKRVLVTGGGGSIGSELCRQLIEFDLAELIIFEHSEYNLYEIELELRKRQPQLKLSPYLQSVTDEQGVDRLMAKHRPDIVFHAAAYKHVPLLEQQELIAIQNNVLGTKVVAEAANRHQVSKFVLISTDKAVNPTNVMGTTKRIAEIFCQNFNQHSKTKFVTVRFGNVLGSAGSVVPLFRKQMEAGGPLTITHPDITRYFMTIPEASQLILQASLLGEGGEIFVLDMGQPIKIRDLAEQMIRLSGKKLGEDIEIAYVGLRPGEKLYEELFHETEALQKTANQKIFQAQARQMDWAELLSQLKELTGCCAQHHTNQARDILVGLVPEATLTNTPKI